MLFWIIIALILVSIVVATILSYRKRKAEGRFGYPRYRGFWLSFLDSLGIGIVVGLAASFIGGLVIAAVLIPITLGNSHVVSDTHEKRQLVSLQTAQQGKFTGGYRYYLGSGSSGTGYTYMYQAKDSNGSNFYQLANAAASDSKVYTLDPSSDQTPSVDIENAHWEGSNKWLLPWAFDNGVGHAYTFYVPKDSIVSNYQAN